jgi:hypothetical protein
MDVNKVAVKAVLVTLGAAFLLLSVVEWKKMADLMPSDDSRLTYGPAINPDAPYSASCVAGPLAPPTGRVAGTALSDCQGVFGTNVPWTQGIKAFVYSWIGIGLLVAAFIKPKGVSGGYW